MSEDESQFVFNDDETAPVLVDPEEEFKIDRLRIDYYTALRRGAIRSRTWWFAACCMSAIFIVDMVIQATMEYWKNHVLLWPAVRLLAAAASVRFAVHALGRAGDFAREMKKSALPEPSIPPDFSTLGNGEERWKALESVR